MASTRETALLGLKTALKTLSGPTVERNTESPDEIPADGLVILRDGDPGEPDVVLSPLTYLYEHEADVEALVQEADDADRDTALDDLLSAIADALSADPTLGGAVDVLEVREPEIDGEEVTGAADIKGATVPVILYYATTNPLK